MGNHYSFIAYAPKEEEAIKACIRHHKLTNKNFKRREGNTLLIGDYFYPISIIKWSNNIYTAMVSTQSLVENEIILR